jgi:ElaB/YqjD/DUF883 family membrane-anchored ribosome-binding protein
MPNPTRTPGNPTGYDPDDTTAESGQRSVAAAFDQGRSAAADGLDTAASAIEDEADDLPGGTRVRNLARSTATRLNATADYVRSHDAKRMMADVDSFVRNNPGPALVASAVFGFLLSRAMSRE